MGIHDEKETNCCTDFSSFPNARGLEIQITPAPASQAIAERKEELFFTFGLHHLTKPLLYLT